MLIDGQGLPLGIDIANASPVNVHLIAAPLQNRCRRCRYRHRRKVERTISWLGNCRRLLVRHEHFDHLCYGFAQLACVNLLMKRVRAF